MQLRHNFHKEMSIYDVLLRKITDN